MAVSRQRYGSLFIQFRQWPFIQRDKPAARSIDIDNYCNDDRDETGKNESLKNRVTSGCSRGVSDKPHATTGYAQQ